MNHEIIYKHIRTTLQLSSTANKLATQSIPNPTDTGPVTIQRYKNNGFSYNYIITITDDQLHLLEERGNSNTTILKTIPLSHPNSTSYTTIQELKQIAQIHGISRYRDAQLLATNV